MYLGEGKVLDFSGGGGRILTWEQSSSNLKDRDKGSVVFDSYLTDHISYFYHGPVDCDTVAQLGY